ncbi:MAG: GDYXXLXY domain-containing protein [Alcanivoracaceae bacterium]|nr:GDYXXLXY domain-containing protein [Alcanivoracaceae bacterium]
MNTQDLWQKLLQNKLVTEENSPADAHSYEQEIPWYIRFMQGFGGWLAALFLVGFFATAFSFLFKQPTGGLLISVGVLCSIAAYIIIRLQKNDFFEQLGMAFSLCGQLMVAIGLFFLLKIENRLAFFILAGYQLVLAWIIPQYAHRLLSSSFGLLALLIALNLAGFHGIGSAFIAVLFSFIWLKENSWDKDRDLWEAIGFAVAITMVFSSGFLLTGKFLLKESIRGDSSWLFIHAELISSLLIALVFVNLVISLLKEHKIALSSTTAILSLLAAAGLVLISYKIYGISTGLLIVIIGFARSRMSLMVLGSMAVISFFSWYYYNLQLTLLVKSMVLIVLGLAMLAAWFSIGYIYARKVGNNAVNKRGKFKLHAFGKNKYLGIITIIIALIAINININKKQHLIANGEVLLFKLTPVDPRSLMQGDYMRLRFELAAKIQDHLRLLNGQTTIPAQQGFAVVMKDENNVVSFVDLFHNQQITDTQYMIPFKFRNYRVVFTTNAFYFQEGQASHFQKARFGQFKMADGEMLLLHMLDEDLKVL